MTKQRLQLTGFMLLSLSMAHATATAQTLGFSSNTQLINNVSSTIKQQQQYVQQRGLGGSTILLPNTSLPLPISPSPFRAIDPTPDSIEVRVINTDRIENQRQRSVTHQEGAAFSMSPSLIPARP